MRLLLLYMHNTASAYASLDQVELWLFKHAAGAQHVLRHFPQHVIINSGDMHT